MKIEPKSNCPLNNFEPCKQVECAWFTHIRGNNPNTGEEKDDWACAIAWLPFLSVENAHVTRESGAAIESFRNEMVKANKNSLKILTNKKLLLEQNGN